MRATPDSRCGPRALSGATHGDPRAQSALARFAAPTRSATLTPRSAVLTTTTHVPEAEAALCAPLASRHVQEPHLRLAGASAAPLPVGHARPPAAALSAVAGLLLFGSSGLSPSPQKTCSGRGLALGLSTISVKTALVERKRPLVRALPRLGRRSRRPRVACWALVRGSLVRARSLSRPWTSQPLSPAHSDGAPSRPFSPRALVLVAALASADSCCSAAPLLARPVRRRPSCASSSCRVRACDAAPLATEVRHRLRLRLAWSPRAPLSPLRLSLTLRGTDVRSPPSVRRPPSCVPSRPRVRACSIRSRFAATVRDRTWILPEPSCSRPPFASQSLALSCAQRHRCSTVAPSCAGRLHAPSAALSRARFCGRASSPWPRRCGSLSWLAMGSIHNTPSVGWRGRCRVLSSARPAAGRRAARGACMPFAPPSARVSLHALLPSPLSHWVSRGSLVILLTSALGCRVALL